MARDCTANFESFVTALAHIVELGNPGCVGGPGGMQNGSRYAAFIPCSAGSPFSSRVAKLLHIAL